MVSCSLLYSRILNVIIHFFKRLIETPLLLGYIVVGLFITFGLHGFNGLTRALKNLLLLLIWALIIRIMTEETSPLVKIKNAKFELFIGAIFIVYDFISAIFIHLNRERLFLYANKVNILLHKFLDNYFPSYNLNFVLLSKYLVSAITSTIFFTIPMILIYLLMGYKFKEIGFRRVYWKLTFVLLGLTILLGVCGGFYDKMEKSGINNIMLVILYSIQIFINGLPEELIFRGFLLSRLEKVLNNSINALVISALIFSLLHIPSMVIKQHVSISYALLDQLALIQPTGLIWGYLYLRTRSIIPGMLWHTSFGTLGIIFF